MEKQRRLDGMRYICTVYCTGRISLFESLAACLLVCSTDPARFFHTQRELASSSLFLLFFSYLVFIVHHFFLIRREGSHITALSFSNPAKPAFGHVCFSNFAISPFQRYLYFPWSRNVINFARLRSLICTRNEFTIR